MRLKKLWIVFLVLSASARLFAQDTFSIVAVDSATGQVGSAGASCLQAPKPSVGCLIISDIIPGTGAIHTQALWNGHNQFSAHQLLVDDKRAPADIIKRLIKYDVDSNPGVRQYAIACFDSAGSPKTAAYTGAVCLSYKSHIVGPNYVIAGNILAGQQILDSMEARFLRTNGPLADKLMAALQGANVPGADKRCKVEGVPAQSAFLRVAKPGDSKALYLDLLVKSRPYGISPIDSLQVLFNKQMGKH